MKWIWSFLLCWSASAQSPLATGSGIEWTKSASSGALSPVAGYVFWYSITNGVVDTNGTSPPADGKRITSWADLGPNSYNLSNLAASAVGPVYRTASHSTGSGTNPPVNCGYIYFDTGINCYITNRFSTTYSQPNTYFLVLNGQAGRSGSAVPVLNPTANQNQQITWPASAQPTLYAGSAQSGPLSDNPASVDNKWVVYTFQFNTTSSVLRSNSVSLALSGTTVGSGGLQGITLGNYFNLSGGGGSGVLMVEFVGYNSALSAANMKLEEEYLAQKYGITSVP